MPWGGVGLTTPGRCTHPGSMRRDHSVQRALRHARYALLVQVQEDDLIIRIHVGRRLSIQVALVGPANILQRVVLVPVWLVYQEDHGHLLDHDLLDAKHRLFLSGWVGGAVVLV